MTPRPISYGSGYQVYLNALILLERVHILSINSGRFGESGGIARIYSFEMEVAYAHVLYFAIA